MGGHKLGGLNLAQQLVGVAADAVVLHLGHLYQAIGVNQERSAVGHSLVFLHHAEAAAEHAGGVGKHRILYFLYAVRGVVPCLVHEVGVCAHREHLDAHLLQAVVFLGQVHQFGGANEGEVGRVEEEQGPLALQVFAAHCLELSILECLYLELRHLCVDY